MCIRDSRWATHGKVNIGVKQFALIVFGILGLIRGISYINPPEIPEGLGTIAQLVPLTCWGVLWIAIGLLALIGAFTRHYRMPFVPLMVMSAVWAASFAAEWGMDYFIRETDSRYYVTAASYAVQTVAILTIMRLIDPSEVLSERGPDD